MATQFAMPVPATHGAYATQNQYNLYNQQSQTSPLSSATATPNQHSPTSPRSTFDGQVEQHARQLRPLKSPLYIPAVLRPTNPPRRNRPSPPTPQSTNSSFESATSVKPVDRRNTGDSGKGGLGRISENEFTIQGLGKVTGYPTTQHWKSDASAMMCDSPTCRSQFSLFTRRHHCRRCGNIFCDSHSSNVVPLDQDANFHPSGIYARACDFCHTEWKGWEVAMRSRSNSSDSTASSATQPFHGAASEPSTPTIGCKGKAGMGGLKGVFGKGGVAESLGASVPRDWNWSTF